MKTIFALILTLLLSVSFAQDKKYEQAMMGAVGQLYNAATTDEFTAAANLFERISHAEPNEWLPLYHAAYAYLVMAFTVEDAAKKDPYFDKVQDLIDRALKIAPEESEIYALQAFLYPGMITVDPMGRGAVLIGKMNDAIDKAIGLNPENPRPYYLRAVTLLNMPEEFGGGKEAAKPIFETARGKFENFSPVSPMWPAWGKEMNEEELSKL